MASEIEIREAIVARMISALAIFTPAPIVIGRDITGILEMGAYSGLLDTDDPPKIHVWVVTQRSLLPVDVRQGGTLYELVYNLTQIVQYRSGTDVSNSDREASLERDAVTNAFRYAGELPQILKFAHVKPVEWPSDSIDRPEPITKGTARMSRAILRASNFYGPVACS
jgi:hypothetical protein